MAEIMALELNRIYNMDCLEGMRQMEDKSVDLIICDSPYNISKAEWDTIKDYDAWMLMLFREFQRALNDNGSLYVFHNDFLKVCDFQQLLRTNTNFI
jgi:site-specific DNA-methyltransferase (adenine-specific)